MFLDTMEKKPRNHADSSPLPPYGGKDPKRIPNIKFLRNCMNLLGATTPTLPPR